MHGGDSLDFKVSCTLYFVTDPESESESESEPESESIRSPESEPESESEQPHRDSAPLDRMLIDLNFDARFRILSSFSIS